MSTQPALLRTRWSAIGAAIAITVGAGGLSVAQAAIDSGDRPVTVSVAAERVLDTRSNLGLAGRFADATPRDVQITGSVPVASGGSKVVVPADAIGVLVNVTVLNPSNGGFLSLRPQGAVGVPTTSTVNFSAGSIEPNAATVDMNDGQIQVWVEMSSGASSAHVLLDVVGYTIDHTHDDRYYTESESDAAVAAAVAPKADSSDVYTRPEVDTAIENRFAGTTIRGAFNIGFTATGSGQPMAEGISFGVELETPPAVHLIPPGDTPPAGCSGTSGAPGAVPGHLCVFETVARNQSVACIARTAPSYLCNLSNTFGASVYITSSGAGATESLGTWALGVPAAGSG